MKNGVKNLKKNISKISILFTLVTLMSCQSPDINRLSNDIKINSSLKSKYNITGKSEFPLNSTNSFKTKADITQVASKATISLIYTNDHPTSPNVTIITGLTDSNGNFSLDPSSFFSPAVNDVFLLESSKRIGSAGNSLITVRTYVRWSGSNWESISFPQNLGVKVNSKTTSITLIDALNNTISSNECINKLDVSSNPSVVSDIGTVLSTEIERISDIVNTLISSNEDPTRFITFKNGKYSSVRPENIGRSTLIDTKYCPSCDLKNEDFSNLNLDNSDLSNADLSNSNLSIVNLNNSNLSNSNLFNTNLNFLDAKNSNFSGVNFTNSILTNAYFVGSNLSNAIGLNVRSFKTFNLTNVNLSGVNLSGSDFSTSNLTNTDFTNANLSNVNFSEAVLTGTIFTNVDLSNDIWTDKSICLSNSIGVCNSELKINTYTNGIQINPKVAVDSSNSFIVVWQGEGNGDDNGIFAQRFNSSGVAQGSELKINTYTTGIQSNPEIVVDSTNNFVVVWQGEGDGDDNGIFAQRISSSGFKEGSEFRVNTYTTGIQSNPSIASGSQNSLFITWNGEGSEDNQGVYLKYLNSDATQQYPEFKVNTYTTGIQSNPSIAANTNGNIVIAWQGEGSGDINGLYTKRFNGFGSSVGDDIQVNTYTTGNQFNPSVGIDGTGKFSIVWEGSSSNDNDSIYSKRFFSDGSVSESEFLVSLYTTGVQENASISMNTSGNFVISWDGEGENENQGIFSKFFDNNGTVQGGEFKMNTYTTNIQKNPNVFMNNNGRIMSVWQSMNQEGNSTDGIYSKRYKY